MPDSCSCTVKIADLERARRFAGIFPDDEIPIRYPILAGQARTVRNGQDEGYSFYEVAIERFTPEQKQRVAEAVAHAGFRDVTIEEVLRDMENPKMVIPLKADGAIVSWCSLHTNAAIPDFDNSGEWICPSCGDPVCHSCAECSEMECECTCADLEGF